MGIIRPKRTVPNVDIKNIRKKNIAKKEWHELDDDEEDES